MSKRCAVIGLGRFGTEVVRRLTQSNFPVLAIDRKRFLVEEMSAEVDNAICFDTTNENALREARISDMDVVVCAIGDSNIENSILTTALLKQLGVPRIIARSSTELHTRILKIVGATEVVNPEKDMGDRVARKIMNPGLNEVIPISEGVSVANMNVPQEFIGKSLIELRIRSRYNVNIIGIRRLKEPNSLNVLQANEEKDMDLILAAEPNQHFCAGDILLVAGSEENIMKISKLKK